MEALRHNTRTCKTEGNAISATLQENGITSESHITPVSEATAPSMNSHVYEVRYRSDGRSFFLIDEETGQGEATGELVARVEVLRDPVSAKIFEELGVFSISRGCVRKLATNSRWPPSAELLGDAFAKRAEVMPVGDGPHPET